jgi:uncharacterized protein YkwD
MLTQCLRATVVAAAATAAIVSASAPVGVAVASSRTQAEQSRIGHGHAQPASRFDSALLGHSNRARAAHRTSGYSMSRTLSSVARRWAQHLARTGVLAHNPSLTKQITSLCPRWTAIGENVGVVNAANDRELFAAYMASPEHRANILDPAYRQIGIATVKVTTATGQVREWDVMDFGDRC